MYLTKIIDQHSLQFSKHKWPKYDFANSIHRTSSFNFLTLSIFSDQLRPSTKQIPDFFPTIHPNSVLPFHNNVDYEEYYEDYEETATKPMSTDFVVTTSKPEILQVPQIFSKDLPQFVENPENSYIIRGQPAVLRCKVIHADKAYFSCNGEAMAASEFHKEVDKVEISETAAMEPINVKSLSLQLNRINIEEFFGVFTCRCDAWSAKGMTSSKNASVEFACK